MRTLRWGGAAVLGAAVGLGTLAIASPAQAQDDCKTVTTTLADRPDSAVGGGTWALDQLTRTVQVCQTAEGEYHAEVTDEGTFSTVALDHTPAGVDQELPAGIEGMVVGGFTADFEADPDWASFDASHLDGQTITGADGLPTGEWVSSLFGDDFDGSSINDDWSWTYTTVCGDQAQETWVNQTDALGGNQGDITMEPTCPTPTPTPTITTAPTGEPTTAPGQGGEADDDSLPVTGVSVPMLLAGGGVLGLVGGGVYLLARRRRVSFTA